MIRSEASDVGHGPSLQRAGRHVDLAVGVPGEGVSSKALLEGAEAGVVRAGGDDAMFRIKRKGWPATSENEKQER
jgi:hypothetical protein